MNNETLEKMRQLRLFGMCDAFKTNPESSVKESLTPDQFISLLVASEWDDRKNRAVERSIRQANFRYKASLEQIDFSIDRGLDKNEVHRLAALDFVKEHKDVFITGSTGTGKSFLATAIGYQACQEGYRVMYVNTAKLMGQLKLAKAKGTVLSDLKRIERMDVLILDDFGLQPFHSQSRIALLDVIGEKTIADAVLDRIVHHSLRVELYGESLRRRKNKEENGYL